MKPIKTLRILACVAAAALLTACATVEEEVGTCEPGVAEISEMSTVTPAGC